jgi:hypothetical protein
VGKPAEFLPTDYTEKNADHHGFWIGSVKICEAICENLWEKPAEFLPTGYTEKDTDHYRFWIGSVKT